MSGAAGGGRIPRSTVEQTVKDYSEKILSKIEGFKDAKLSGSFNRPDKEDFGDIDIIVTIETGEDKKTVKQKIATLFQSLPDSELPPLQNPKYKGKKFINHGEMVSNLYPISGMPGEYVQIDNIISLSAEEGDFKKTILDYPAELQGLILGLVKVPLLEEDPKKVFSRLGIDNIPEPKEDQEYEFHIDTSGLTLRLVTYGGNYKILDSNIVWQSRSFDDVRTLLKDFNLDGTFEDLMQQLQGLKNERSKNRVKGYFAKSIKVGAAEQGTPKGDSKQNALDAVSMLEENRRILSRAKLMTKFLDEDAKPRIAVFPGAFKPPHRDHVGRILAAANKVGEDGKVLVLISPLDRAKEGEEPISAKQAAAVFELYKEKGIIPLNVTVKVSEMNSPIGAAYKEFESDPTQPYIAVFGKDDAPRYRNIEDRLPNVTPDSFEDANVGDISASDLRKAIAQRDKEVITRYLPTGITADEYLNTLGIDKPLDEGDTESAADLWTPHASMLAKMRKEPELLKGLWKGLSKPSRRALVLYFRREKQREAAAPLEEAAETVKEAQGKKLRVFDFDDTLVHVDATIYITHEDGSKEGLTPAEYAVYEPQPGDKFNFKEFSSVIKKAKPLEDNIQDLIKSYNDPTEKTTILTARLLGYPVKKYLRDEFNIEPYVVGLGSSDPQDKAKWIEDQIKKGYTTIEFRDDSAKNVDAVAALQDKHPEITLTSILIKENASYSSDIDYKGKILELTKHMLRKGMNIKPLPKVKFVNGDSDNARQFLGKTAYYDPNNKTIVLYTEGRHPKDIVRSFAHEMVHHTQNLENRLGDVSTTNTMEDDNIDKLEQEANLKGTMTFRNWTDSLNENTTTNSYPFKVNELRQGFLNYLKQQLPNFPDYVIKDWIYKMIKKDDNINTAEGIQDWIDTQLKDLKWETKINFPITMDIFGDKTQKELKSRIGGEIRQDVDKDIERHKTQQNLLKSQGISKEPIIIFKTKDGKYELGEGWHRTTQSFKLYPEGFIQPNVYIGLNAKWLDENLSKLKEAKNKDPFGLNQYARELAQGLEETIVMEGRYDTISNQISSEIFNNWKAQFDKNNTTEEALFTKSYDLENAAGRPIVFDLVASLTFKETEEGTYSVNGDADEGDEEVYDADGELEDEGLDGSISMYFQVDPRELPRLWSKISMDLKDIVRHEIEHLTQAGYNVVDSKRLPDDRMLRMYIQDLKTMPERDYYLLDKEIPAMLQGMYFKAKKMKEPFAKVVNDYLTIQKVSDEDREIILNRWRPAAKTLNLPNL
jgi:predicted nucleotidyltransferase